MEKIKREATLWGWTRVKVEKVGCRQWRSEEGYNIPEWTHSSSSSQPRNIITTPKEKWKEYFPPSSKRVTIHQRVWEIVSSRTIVVMSFIFHWWWCSRALINSITVSGQQQVPTKLLLFFSFFSCLSENLLVLSSHLILPHTIFSIFFSFQTKWIFSRKKTQTTRHNTTNNKRKTTGRDDGYELKSV